MKTTTLTPELLHKMDAYWRAANYLSVGQIYLYDNPLLKRPLTLADVKHMLLGHWGTTPGQNFIYAHLNRVITKYDLDMIYVSGPGHGGQAGAAPSGSSCRCRPKKSSASRTRRRNPRRSTGVALCCLLTTNRWCAR
jgi:phosphoketolase